MFYYSSNNNLKLIYFLVKEKRFTIEGAKNKLKTGKDKNLEQMEMIKSLESLKSFLLEIKKEL